MICPTRQIVELTPLYPVDRNPATLGFGQDFSYSGVLCNTSRDEEQPRCAARPQCFLNTVAAKEQVLARPQDLRPGRIIPSATLSRSVRPQS